MKKGSVEVDELEDVGLEGRGGGGAEMSWLRGAMREGWCWDTGVSSSSSLSIRNGSESAMMYRCCSSCAIELSSASTRVRPSLRHPTRPRLNSTGNTNVPHDCPSCSSSLSPPAPSSPLSSSVQTFLLPSHASPPPPPPPCASSAPFSPSSSPPLPSFQPLSNVHESRTLLSRRRR